MAIHFFSEQVDMPVFNKKNVRAWISNVIKQHEKEVGEINFIFTSDKFLLEINQKYLNHDTYTDIISFDYTAENTIHGDIYISVERVAENAKNLGTESTELFRVIIHGILHLLGYSDDTPESKQKMTAKEDECLKILEL
ncbi:MAG: rRNA maturation RNase YbeY [Bacteroidales bacterium]|nr:rRNA maturation RNase YbeY [Bacteroidales bacterium]